MGSGEVEGVGAGCGTWARAEEVAGIEVEMGKGAEAEKETVARTEAEREAGTEVCRSRCSKWKQSGVVGSTVEC